MKKFLKFQLRDLMIGYLFYALIMILLTVIVTIISVTHSNMNITLNGNGLASGIFCFVGALAMYKEHCQMAVQNSVSRKDFFKSSITMLTLASLLCALLDLILQGIRRMAGISPDYYSIDSTGSFVLLFYPGFRERSSAASVTTAGFLLTFITCLLLASFAILIAGIYCRIPKKFRTVYCVAVPVISCGLFPVLPLFEIFFPGSFIWLMDIFRNIMGIPGENPYLGIPTFAAVSVVIGWISYRILRKTEISD